MSERKSWDIQPRAKKPAPVAKPSAPRRASVGTMRDMHAKPRPKPVAAEKKPSVSVSKKNVTIARGTRARTESKEPLKKRRKKAKKAILIVIGIALLLLALGMLYLAWQPMLRISTVSAKGPHAEEAELAAKRSLEGTHAFILPRNSLFFIPEEDIRSAILLNHPDIEAVSLSASGLTTLLITTLPRSEAFSWCGIAPESADGRCYNANAEGLIFAEVPPETASTSQTLKLFSPINGQEGNSPIRAHIAYASRIPETLRFVKAMQTLGADVVSAVLRDDEADLYTQAGTRITYVLGREQEAAVIAASVFPQLSLNDGSIRYVDLRFSGKAYFKRVGEEEAAPTE